MSNIILNNSNNLIDKITIIGNHKILYVYIIFTYNDLEMEKHHKGDAY
jgi:hypothetical protein